MDIGSVRLGRISTFAEGQRADRGSCDGQTTFAIEGFGDLGRRSSHGAASVLEYRLYGLMAPPDLTLTIDAVIKARAGWSAGPV
jgi:hypothetical protein